MDQARGRSQRGHAWWSIARTAWAVAAAAGCRGAPAPAPSDTAAAGIPAPAVDAAAPRGPRDAGAAAAVDAGAAGPADAGLAAAAPVDAGAAPPPGWVDIAAAIPDAVLDLRYATANNIAGVALYPVARCWMRAAGAERLARAAADLRGQGFRLLLWDCYRPASVQQALWDRVRDPTFVARPVFDDRGRPVRGSVHSRGLAVDVGLADASGAVVPLPTDHDDFSAAARGDQARGPARANMRALRAAMVAAGFRPLASEWWHYEAGGARGAPLSDEPLR